MVIQDEALAPGQLLLIYDGTCGFCSAVARRVIRLDWRRALAWQPSQAAGLREAVGLSRADVEAALWAVLPTGERRSGAAATCTMLDALLPGGPPLLATLQRVPGLRQLTDAGYRWLAANRQRIPGVPACGIDQRVPPLPAGVRAELVRRCGEAAATRPDPRPAASER